MNGFAPSAPSYRQPPPQVTHMSEDYGKPTAMKVRGTAFYAPAIITAFGPKPLPHGERQDTRHAAIKEAKRVLAEAENHPRQETSD